MQPLCYYIGRNKGKQYKEEQTMKREFYIEFKNGYFLRGLDELALYKTLYLGYTDENGVELEVANYGEIL